MATLLNQTTQENSTRRISELLILDVVNRLGQPRLSELHRALRKATEGGRVVFFVGQPLRNVLEGYRELKQVRLVRPFPEPSYELTSIGRNNIRKFEVTLRGLFPAITQIRRGHI